MRVEQAGCGGGGRRGARQQGARVGDRCCAGWRGFVGREGERVGEGVGVSRWRLQRSRTIAMRVLKRIRMLGRGRGDDVHGVRMRVGVRVREEEGQWRGGLLVWVQLLVGRGGGRDGGASTRRVQTEGGVEGRVRGGCGRVGEGVAARVGGGGAGEDGVRGVGVGGRRRLVVQARRVGGQRGKGWRSEAGGGRRWHGRVERRKAHTG